MSSIIRRVFSHGSCLLSPRLLSPKINGSRRLLSARKFCTATAAVNRELLQPSSPWLMLRPSFVAGDMIYNLFSPINRKVVSFNNRGGKEEVQLMRCKDTTLVGSSHGWLAMYNKRNHNIFLCNPLSGRRIHLPPFDGKPFHDEEFEWYPWKIILSCSPHDEDCRALMVVGSGDRAAFCLPGRSSEWSPLGRWYKDPVSVETFNYLRMYIDFAYCAPQQNFLGYVMSFTSFRQDLEGWDVTDPVRPRTIRLDRLGMWDPCPWETYSLSNVYLVCGEEPGQLFLVRRIFLEEEEKLYVIVYRVKDGELVPCSSLDGMTMFVGINHSVAARIPGLKPNSIYFCDARNKFGQLVGVFDYQNQTCSPVYHNSVLLQSRQKQAWFTPTLD